MSVSSRYHQLPWRIEDDYDISDKVLGSGYNGVVRQAFSKGCSKRQQFAVKAFKLGGLEPEKKQQLESEISCFMGMDHPHIARLFDVYETDEFMHLVMECLEGGELFDRVMQRKRYAESDAAEATRQMLLALNYMHSHEIVHRDIKLENFLYDVKNGSHLKLIDFGFSKVIDPGAKMHASCGTLSYVAPEVLDKNYTSQCDLWSLGVVAFILLSGYMPFAGSEQTQKANISTGKYKFKPERWGNVSGTGVNFVQQLLQVDPRKRLNAEQALEHQWIKARRSVRGNDIDLGVLEGLRQFGKASKFRRCCMELMAWSLSNEERAEVREYFEKMDQNNQGTITLVELKEVMTEKFRIPDSEIQEVFEALDSNHDDTIHYSDFLAAMLNTRLALHDDLLRSAFRRFDTDSSGFITVDNLRQVLGDSFEGASVEDLMNEADLLKDNRISYAEFVAYLRGEQLGKAADAIISNELERLKTPTVDDVAPSGLWSSPKPMISKKRPSGLAHLAPPPPLELPPLAGALPGHKELMVAKAVLSAGKKPCAGGPHKGACCCIQ